MCSDWNVFCFLYTVLRMLISHQIHSEKLSRWRYNLWEVINPWAQSPGQSLIDLIIQNWDTQIVPFPHQVIQCKKIVTGEGPLQTLILLMFDLGFIVSTAIKIKCLLLIRQKYIFLSILSWKMLKKLSVSNSIICNSDLKPSENYVVFDQVWSWAKDIKTVDQYSLCRFSLAHWEQSSNTVLRE